eukprot:4177640-Pyramimonas_sp.AAC.1
MYDVFAKWCETCGASYAVQPMWCNSPTLSLKLPTPLFAQSSHPRTRNSIYTVPCGGECDECLVLA